jgi:alpha-1,2-mannosyltransferase
VFGDSRFKTGLAICGIAVVAVVFAYHVSQYPMDFRVYHYGARGVFDGTRPVYGPTSGIGWPMHYRYPPLFLLLFAPFAMLPLGLAAAVWLLAKIGILVCVLHAIQKRVPKHTFSSSTRYAYLISAVFIAPYVIEEFRYGNAQFFVLALTVGGLLLLRDRPAVAAASLGFAISLKVWPVFFIPYLAVRREWKTVANTVAFAVFLSLLPSLYFGLSGNFDLLNQWYAQESQTQLGKSEIWFPNQSLRGVLMRYLTVIDYSHVPDSNYAPVNIAAMDPARVRLLWVILAGAIYAGFLLLAHRRRKSNGWLDLGLAFCLLALLEPFTQKYALVILLWPAIAVAGSMNNRPVRILMYCATVLVLIQPLVPGATAQRLMQVLGFDFGAALLLTVAIGAAAVESVAHGISRG